MSLFISSDALWFKVYLVWYYDSYTRFFVVIVSICMVKPSFFLLENHSALTNTPILIFCLLSLLVFFFFLSSNHPNESEMVSPCGCDLHFTSDYDVEHIFNELVGHLYILFGKMSIQVICPFLIGLFGVFFVVFEYMVYLFGLFYNHPFCISI